MEYYYKFGKHKNTNVIHVLVFKDNENGFMGTFCDKTEKLENFEEFDFTEHNDNYARKLIDKGLKGLVSEMIANNESVNFANNESVKHLLSDEDQETAELQLVYLNHNTNEDVCGSCY